MKALRTVLFMVVLAFSLNVSSQTVYTTKTGSKYHKTSCKYLKYPKKEITLEKAKRLGYTPCLVCKPPANNTKTEVSNSSSLAVSNKSNTTGKNSTATQCTGKTKSGTRCKRKTKNANGRCYQH